MRIALVGCGYAADYYLATLPNHPSLSLTGVFDSNPERQRAFTEFHGVPGYQNLPDLLGDPTVELVVNVTNPDSHVEVTEAALLADKHVYTEKPLALHMEEARRCIALAERRGLALGMAPCNLLGSAAQTAWRALRNGLIGRPRLVYANFDTGLFHHQSPGDWFSPSGTPWPCADELRNGIVLEHAGYKLTWLTAFFGPVKKINAFSSRVLPFDHLIGPKAPAADDFAVACMTFEGGVAARLNFSLAAPQDESLLIVGDRGTLLVEYCGDFASPVSIKLGVEPQQVQLPLLDDGVDLKCPERFQSYDFSRGVADLADSASRGVRSHLPIDQALHVLELTLLIASAADGRSVCLDTSFEPVEPMPWAR